MFLLKNKPKRTAINNKLLTTIAIVVLTILLVVLPRILFLNLIPSGFNWDESAYSYNAYTLLQYQSDEYGNKLPLFLQSFGDYKPAFLSYYLAAFFYFFSPNNINARLALLPITTLGLIGIFLLIYKFRGFYFALLTTILVAISPWHIHYSRAVMDPILGFSFFFFGFGILFQQKNNFWQKCFYYFFGGVSLLLSMYVYNAQRLLVPLTFLFILCFSFFYNGKQINFKRDFHKLLFFLIQCLLLFFLVNSRANQRAKDLFLFTDSKYQNHNNEVIYRSTIAEIKYFAYLQKLPTQQLLDFLKQYFIHLQADFLFFGKSLSPRHSFQMHGLLLPSLLPFLIIGMLGFFRIGFNKINGLMFGILLLTPIVGALTTDVPHSGRTLTMLVPLVYFSVEGLLFLWKRIVKTNFFAKNSVFICVMLIIAGNFLFYLRDLYLFFPEKSSSAWQEPMIGLHNFFVAYQLENKHNTIDWHLDLSDDPKIFFAWYGLLSPKQYRPSNDWQYIDYNGIKVFAKRYSDKEKACLLLQDNTILVEEFSKYSIAEINNVDKIGVIKKLNRFHEEDPFYAIYKTGGESAGLREICNQ